MKLSDQIRQTSPYSSPEKGCAQLILGIIASILLATLPPLAEGIFDWRIMPGHILMNMGGYWFVSTVLFAIYNKRKKSVDWAWLLWIQYHQGYFVRRAVQALLASTSSNLSCSCISKCYNMVKSDDKLNQIPNLMVFQETNAGIYYKFCDRV